MTRSLPIRIIAAVLAATLACGGNGPALPGAGSGSSSKPLGFGGAPASAQGGPWYVGGNGVDVDVATATISLASCTTIGDVWKWNGTAFACTADVTSVVAGTGISTSTTSGAATVALNINAGVAQTCGAGTVATALSGTGIVTCTAIGTAGGTTGTGTATKLPIWTGTSTLGNSDITQSGGFVSTPSNEQWTITTNLANASTQHGALTIYTQGVGLTVGDGGVQSFNSSSINTTAGPSQALAVYGGCSATKSAGTNPLTCYAFLASATGGDNQYAFYGSSGNFYDAGAGQFGGALTVGGLISANAGITVASGQPVSLSTNVGAFAMPNGGGSSLIIGSTGTIAGSSGIIQAQNTGATRFVETDMIGNTTTNASAIPRFGLYRGAGGGSLAGALWVDDGSTTAAGDLLLYGTGTLNVWQSTAGKVISIPSTGITAFQKAVTINGTLGMTSHQINNLANGTVSTDAAAFGQIGSAVTAAVSGTANTLAMFTGTNVVGNSPLVYNGTDTITGPRVYAVSSSLANPTLQVTQGGATPSNWYMYSAIGSTTFVLGNDNAGTTAMQATYAGDVTLPHTLTVNGTGANSTLTLHHPGTAQTVDGYTITGDMVGSYNTTAAAHVATTLNLGASSAISAGANLLTDRVAYLSASGTTGVANLGLEVNASGGTVNNIAIETDAGDNLINTTGGKTVIGGSFAPAADQFAVTMGGAAGANSFNSATITNTTSFDTTAAVRTTDGLKITNTNTVAAGANVLTSIALEVTNTSTASATLVPIAIQTDTGNNLLNQTSGSTQIGSGGIVFMSATAGTSCLYGTNSSGSCEFNATGYQDGTTQFRNFRVRDGKGNQVFFLNPSNATPYTELDLPVAGSGGTAPLTLINNITGINEENVLHLEYPDEWMQTQAGATIATGTLIGTSYQVQYSGTGAGVAAPTQVSNRPGIIALNIGTATAGGYSTVISDVAGVDFADGDWDYEWVGNWPTLSSSSTAIATEYASLVGFFDAASTVNVTDGCYFAYDKGNFLTGGPNAGNVDALECWCASNGVRTKYLINATGNSDESFALGTGTVAAGTFYRLKVHIKNATRAEFYRNGTKVCDINTNLPTGTARRTGMGFGIFSNAATGTGARSIETDWTKWDTDKAAVRSP